MDLLHLRLSSPSSLRGPLAQALRTSRNYEIVCVTLHKKPRQVGIQLSLPPSDHALDAQIAGMASRRVLRRVAMRCACQIFRHPYPSFSDCPSQSSKPGALLGKLREAEDREKMA